VQPAPFAELTDGRYAIRAIFEAPGPSDGGRHLNIGQTGSGKTYLDRALLEELVRSGRVRWTFTLDDKDHAHTPYDGLPYVNPAAFEAQPPTSIEGYQDERRIVFRGDFAAGVVCSAEEVAKLGEKFARAGVPVAINFDELKRAAMKQRSWTAPTVLWLYTESRSTGAWVLGNTTNAKRLPDDALTEASSISVFRQKARAAHYVTEVLDLTDDVADVITGLGLGEFVLLTQEEDWDGRIYRL
jgi:hypothetical protein